MKKLLFLLLILVSLSSCWKKETVFLRSYITYYSGVDEISLMQRDVESKDISIMYKAVDVGNYKSTGKLKESYDALCEKHNDMSYNKEITLITKTEDNVRCIGTDFISIDMVSNSDFDAEHPAGSSLGDLVIFTCFTYKPYIDSGYNLVGEYYYPYTKLEMFLWEMTSEHLTLLTGNKEMGVLNFNKQPTLSKEHTLTVTMTSDKNEVFTASIDMEFD